MRNKLNIIFACLYLLTNVLSAGRVVCIGDDGHTSIEKRHISNHCPTSHDDHEHHDHEDEIISEVEDHCEPCVDTPLQDDAKLVGQNPETVVYGVFEPCNIEIVEKSYDLYVKRDSPPSQYRLDQTLALLRTIILII